MLFEKQNKKEHIEDLLLYVKYLMFIPTPIYMEKCLYLSLPFYWWAIEQTED